MTSAPTILEKQFRSVLESHLGKTFMVINPETFQETGVGHAIQHDWYRGKLVAIGDDFIVLVLQFQHGGGKNAKLEPVEQYVPLHHIKRVSILKHDRFLHL